MQLIFTFCSLFFFQSDFAKMLNQKRASRGIDAKQKKILAMLEEETVIDDPKAKAVLVGYKKLEVCTVVHLYGKIVLWPCCLYVF